MALTAARRGRRTPGGSSGSSSSSSLGVAWPSPSPSSEPSCAAGLPRPRADGLLAGDSAAFLGAGVAALPRPPALALRPALGLGTSASAAGWSSLLVASSAGAAGSAGVVAASSAGASALAPSGASSVGASGASLLATSAGGGVAILGLLRRMALRRLEAGVLAGGSVPVAAAVGVTSVSLAAVSVASASASGAAVVRCRRPILGVRAGLGDAVGVVAAGSATSVGTSAPLAIMLSRAASAAASGAAASGAGSAVAAGGATTSAAAGASVILSWSWSAMAVVVR